MRQKLAFLLGLLFGAAAMRLFVWKGIPSRNGAADPRAEELRRTLADQRRTPIENEQSAPPSDPRPSVPLPRTEQQVVTPDIESMHDTAGERKRIYAEGRAALDEMRRSGEPRAGST